MSKVVREDIDQLNAVITVTIEQKDYEEKFLTELKKYRDKSHMRGFRKGKTPMTFLKKAYGKGVLSQIVTDQLQEDLTQYISTQEDVKFIGQPIPAKGVPKVSFDARNLEDYEFKFDIGKSPEFELSGLLDSTAYEHLVVEVSDEMVEAELEAAKNKAKTRVFPEEGEPIEEGDMVKLRVQELDGDELKEDGWESEFSVMLENMKEEVKNEILGKTKGETFKLNIFEVEDVTEEHAKKYFLQMTKADLEEGTEVGPYFEATIAEVSRAIPAELNQAFFDRQFGVGRVNSLEEAKEELRKNIAVFYEGQTENLFWRNFRKELIERHKEVLQLPDDYMKRWLKASNDANTDELIEKGYQDFAKNLKWSILQKKLADQFELTVTQEQIKENIRAQVMSYMGGYLGSNTEFLEGMVQKTLEDPQQIEKAAGEIIEQQLIKKIKETVTLTERHITLDEFKEIVETIQKEDAPPAPENTDASEEEE